MHGHRYGPFAGTARSGSPNRGLGRQACRETDIGRQRALNGYCNTFLCTMSAMVHRIGDRRSTVDPVCATAPWSRGREASHEGLGVQWFPAILVLPHEKPEPIGIRGSTTPRRQSRFVSGSAVGDLTILTVIAQKPGNWNDWQAHLPYVAVLLLLCEFLSPILKSTVESQRAGASTTEHPDSTYCWSPRSGLTPLDRLLPAR